MDCGPDNQLGYCMQVQGKSKSITFNAKEPGVCKFLHLTVTKIPVEDAGSSTSSSYVTEVAPGPSAHHILSAEVGLQNFMRSAHLGEPIIACAGWSRESQDTFHEECHRVTVSRKLPLNAKTALP